MGEGAGQSQALRTLTAHQLHIRPRRLSAFTTEINSFTKVPISPTATFLTVLLGSPKKESTAFKNLLCTRVRAPLLKHRL